MGDSPSDIMFVQQDIFLFTAIHIRVPTIFTILLAIPPLYQVYVRKIFKIGPD